MRKSLFIFFVLAVSIIKLAAQESAIKWENDFKKAQAMAKETGRPMLLDFTASWCKPCHLMDEQFWVLPEVARAIKPFVAVKINYDSRKDLVNKYGAKAIPFVAFTDPLGNLVAFRRGFSTRNSREISQIFNEMPKDFSPVVKYYQALDQKKDDGNALLEIADFYSNSNVFYLSCDFYKRALKTGEIQADAVKKERITATLGANYYASKADEQAIEYLGDYLKSYPQGKNREVVLAMMIISSAKLGKSKDAAKYLEILKIDFPASGSIAVASKAIEDAKNKPDKK